MISDVVPSTVSNFEGRIGRRLEEELTLAAEATDLTQRSVHLQACRYLCALIGLRFDEVYPAAVQARQTADQQGND